MIWEIKDKQFLMKTRFAFLPKKIGNYRIWFQRYYVNYDYVVTGLGGDLVKHYFIDKEACSKWILEKSVKLDKKYKCS